MSLLQRAYNQLLMLPQPATNSSKPADHRRYLPQHRNKKSLSVYVVCNDVSSDMWDEMMYKNLFPTGKHATSCCDHHLGLGTEKRQDESRQRLNPKRVLQALPQVDTVSDDCQTSRDDALPWCTGPAARCHHQHEAQADTTERRGHYRTRTQDDEQEETVPNEA